MQELPAGVHPDRMYSASTILELLLVQVCPRTDVHYRGPSCMLRHQVVHVARPISSQ